jgi:hypothetical protein
MALKPISPGVEWISRSQADLTAYPVQIYPDGGVYRFDGLRRNTWFGINPRLGILVLRDGIDQSSDRAYGEFVVGRIQSRYFWLIDVVWFVGVAVWPQTVEPRWPPRMFRYGFPYESELGRIMRQAGLLPDWSYDFVSLVTGEAAQ